MLPPRGLVERQPLQWMLARRSGSFKPGFLEKSGTDGNDPIANAGQGNKGYFRVSPHFVPAFLPS